MATQDLIIRTIYGETDVGEFLEGLSRSICDRLFLHPFRPNNFVVAMRPPQLCVPKAPAKPEEWFAESTAFPQIDVDKDRHRDICLTSGSWRCKKSDLGQKSRDRNRAELRGTKGAVCKGQPRRCVAGCLNQSKHVDGTFSRVRTMSISTTALKSPPLAWKTSSCSSADVPRSRMV